MPQIQFPNPAGKDASGKDLPPVEYTGISFGQFGGVETFLVIEDGHLVLKNKAQAAKTAAPGTVASGSGTTIADTSGTRVPVRRAV